MHDTSTPSYPFYPCNTVGVLAMPPPYPLRPLPLYKHFLSTARMVVIRVRMIANSLIFVYIAYVHVYRNHHELFFRAISKNRYTWSVLTQKQASSKLK